MSSQLGVWGLAPRKKICAKNYAILSKFLYFFPILQHKVGDYPPVLKVGDLSPCPSLLRRLWMTMMMMTLAKLEAEAGSTPLPSSAFSSLPVLFPFSSLLYPFPTSFSTLLFSSPLPFSSFPPLFSLTSSSPLVQLA